MITGLVNNEDTKFSVKRTQLSDSPLTRMITFSFNKEISMYKPHQYKKKGLRSHYKSGS